MRQIWTTLQHDGPNGLELWLKSGDLDAGRPQARLRADGQPRRLPLVGASWSKPPIPGHQPLSPPAKSCPLFASPDHAVGAGGGPAGQPVSTSYFMQKIWTTLQHDGPNRLGLWLNQALAEEPQPERRGPGLHGDRPQPELAGRPLGCEAASLLKPPC